MCQYNDGYNQQYSPYFDVITSWLRQGALYCHGNEIMYTAGEVLVGYSKGEHKQRYGFGHTYEITAVAVSPDNITVATSQAGT
jgi:hypothetical protein